MFSFLSQNKSWWRLNSMLRHPNNGATALSIANPHLGQSRSSVEQHGSKGWTSVDRTWCEYVWQSSGIAATYASDSFRLDNWSLRSVQASSWNLLLDCRLFGSVFDEEAKHQQKSTSAYRNHVLIHRFKDRRNLSTKASRVRLRHRQRLHRRRHSPAGDSRLANASVEHHAGHHHELGQCLHAVERHNWKNECSRDGAKGASSLELVQVEPVIHLPAILWSKLRAHSSAGWSLLFGCRHIKLSLFDHRSGRHQSHYRPKCSNACFRPRLGINRTLR